MTEIPSQLPDMPSRGELAARRYRSEQFLNLVVDGIKEGTVSSSDDVRQLHSTYVQENSGVGSGFGIDRTWRLAEVTSVAYEPLLKEAAAVKTALELLQEITFTEQNKDE